MSTEVKKSGNRKPCAGRIYSQLLVCLLSVKYNIMREMLNKVTFVSNIFFMILNNATFLIQWMVLFRIRGSIGGYTMKEVMLLWAVCASSYGLSNVLFARVFALPELIINGKLDAYLVQPKNVLLGVMTSATTASAIGDFAYGLIIVCFCGFGIGRILLFLLLIANGALIITAFALLLGSLSFWFVKTEMFGEHMLNAAINFGLYPDGIFKGAVKFLLYYVIPTGMMIYKPVRIMTEPDLGGLAVVAGYAFLLLTVAVTVFYRGLKRYSSGNLMSARV